MANVNTRNYEGEQPTAPPSGRKPCQHCGTPYAAKRPTQRFCKPACRVANWCEHHPRIDLGGMKIQKGDRKPTAQELQAAGFKIGRRA